VKSTTARVVQGSHICMTAKAVTRGEVMALADI